MTNPQTAAVRPRLWLAILSLLALFWFGGEVRRLTLEMFGLHVTLAVACGMGTVLLTKVQPGLARGVGVVVVLLVVLVSGVVWEYLYLKPPLSWPDAIGGAASFVIVPGIIAALYGNRRLGAGWTFVQVTSLAVLAAPVSTIVSITLAVLITRE